MHGNVHDIVLCADHSWSMGDFLSTFFAPSGKVVVHYDPGSGVWFEKDEHAARAARSWLESNFMSPDQIAPHGLAQTPSRLLAKNVKSLMANERTPEVALEALEALLVDESLSTAVIIHYAELIAPDGAVSNLSFHDRTAAARLHRWSLSDDIVGGDNLVVMLTGALSDLSRRITRNPRVGALHLPLPGDTQRAHYLAHIQPQLSPEVGTHLTRVTAGLQLVRSRISLIREVSGHAGQPQDSNDTWSSIDTLPVAEIAARKKEILEQECFGLIKSSSPITDSMWSVVMDPSRGSQSSG